LKIIGGLLLKKKRILTMVLILCLSSAIPVLATVVTSIDEIKVYVNGNKMNFPDQKPMINNDNRTLVPVRFISENLGAEVRWNNQIRTVIISYEESIIRLPIGKNHASIGVREVVLDTKADIVNERTMVPLRFISECLGTEVQWNGDKKEIYISTKMPPANPFVGQPFKPSDLPTDDGYPIYASDRVGAKIMYAELGELPINVGGYIIYNVTVDKENINITQHVDEINLIPIGLYMVENNEITRCRNYQYVQKGGTFTYAYPIKSTLDETPTNINTVSHFALFTYENMEFRMLVLPNPAYEG
jgi:hypothetical protein